MYCDLWWQCINVRKLFKGGNYSRKYGICVEIKKIRTIIIGMCSSSFSPLFKESWLWIYQNREQEVTRTSIMVLSTYIAQYVPSFLVHAFNPMPQNGNLPGLHIFCYMIFNTSTFVNTCIYIFSNRLYASAFEETFGFSIRRKQPGHSVLA